VRVSKSRLTTDVVSIHQKGLGKGVEQGVVFLVRSGPGKFLIANRKRIVDPGIKSRVKETQVQLTVDSRQQARDKRQQTANGRQDLGEVEFHRAVQASVAAQRFMTVR
jgi:hypothetical protein